MNKNSIAIFFALISTNVFGQNNLSLDSCLALFQQNNLLLLAQHYNISAARAAVIQAKIWEQPYFSGELNAINPQDKKLFDIGSNGQKSFAVQQLIYLGNKKKREVDFAKSNVGIAELQFEQLLLSLRHQLSGIFYSIYFDQQKIRSIDVQSSELDGLGKAYQVQANKGNVPLKEVVRLQTLMLALKNERNILQKEITGMEQDLQLITGSTEIINPVASEEEMITKFTGAGVIKDSLLALAFSKSPDYRLAIKNFESQDLYLKWQQSLSTPDITTGLSYDQRGGAFNNQVNLTFGLPLRFWNRNKGNIKIAEAQLDQIRVTREYIKNEVQSKLESAWKIWQQQQEQLLTMDKSIAENLEEVYRGVLSNFQKRNISLLEFTDFMESYNQSTIQLNEMKKQLVLAGLQLNYITNTDLF